MPQALITGSGASGSASFDVFFGYTGAYTAAPHGLVAPILSSDSIGQDPDQTYPSGDDSPVGVQKWNFTITDAAFVRFTLVIPGPDDIDLFLENSFRAHRCFQWQWGHRRIDRTNVTS